MKLNGSILSSGLFVALLSGCTGTGIQTPATVTQNPSDIRPDRSGSWMLPEAKTEDLLYITNYSDVLAFSYPEGKLVGTLKGFVSAVGGCTDRKGDVFFTNFKPVTVYEYAHGGTKRIGSFPTTKAGTVGCAINPVNGDLAITGDTSYVEIYKGAAGKPIILRDKKMFFGGFCTYDPSGDLFFAGYRLHPFDYPQLSELKFGAQTFLNITPNARLEGEASIQWDGRYLTALSFVPWPQGKPTIFQYSISGNRATGVSNTPLDQPASTISQYMIGKDTIIIPNRSSKYGSKVLFYHYPVGGEPYQSLKKLITDPRGGTLSPAQNR